jgi:hypothetical protein
MNETNRSAMHYDMVVIGSGAAGHHGAIRAAKLRNWRSWDTPLTFDLHRSAFPLLIDAVL